MDRHQLSLCVLEDAPVPILVLNLDGSVQHMNPCCERLTGRTLAEVEGKNWYVTFLPEGEREGARSVFGQRGGDPHVHALVTRGGEERQIAWSAADLRDSHGQIVGVVAVGQDVTQRERSERALQRTRDQHEATLRALPDLLFEVDEQGRIFGHHCQRPELLAVPSDAFQSRTFHEVLPADAADACLEAIRQAAQQGHSLGPVYRLLMPRGERWFEPSVARVPSAAGEHARFILLARDVTDRVHAESKIAEQSRLVELIFQHSLDNIVFLDRDFRFVRVSESYARGCAMDAADLVGKGHFDVFPSSFEQEIAPYRQAKHTYHRAARPFVFPDHPEWGTTYWDLALVPILDAAGEIELFLFTLKDVTERRQADDTLRASLSEKEVLLREIHHRVKNNLQVISSLLYLQSTHTADERLTESLKESQLRVASMALTHEMLYQSPELSRIPFSAYVRRLMQTLALSWGVSPDRVRHSVDAGDLTFSVDIAVPCGLMLNEILSNSLKHAYPADASGMIIVDLKLDGAQYRLRISDDGVGLPADFEPRAKASLGIKLVDRLVAQLGGSLQRTSSNTGTGTCYEINFPRELLS